ncbi:hypothetical protein R2X83_003753 [Salmonella enterica]|nr:hypothetical protein [Salmonella enterica]ELQ4286669.1 hypothetical protein [Salmonella enterica]
MSDKKLVKNNIDRFIGDLSGASAALHLIWKYTNEDNEGKKVQATRFLIDEINARAEALVIYVSDAGKLSIELCNHKSEIDIHELLASEQRKAFSNTD